MATDAQYYLATSCPFASPFDAAEILREVDPDRAPSKAWRVAGVGSGCWRSFARQRSGNSADCRSARRMPHYREIA
jgi:hypothetical protein